MVPMAARSFSKKHTRNIDEEQDNNVDIILLVYFVCTYTHCLSYMCWQLESIQYVLACFSFALFTRTARNETHKEEERTNDVYGEEMFFRKTKNTAKSIDERRSS
jgi:hypothetical protein